MWLLARKPSDRLHVIYSRQSVMFSSRRYSGLEMEDYQPSKAVRCSGETVPGKHFPPIERAAAHVKGSLWETMHSCSLQGCGRSGIMMMVG